MERMATSATARRRGVVMAKITKVLCPLLKSECVEDGAIVEGELCGCRFWVQIIGKDPTTGEPLNRGDCAIAWQPVLMIENSLMQRQTGAAVESFRNEMVSANQLTHQVLIAQQQG